MKTILYRAGSAALNLLLPPLCIACDRPVEHHQALCATCWGGISFVTAPLCSCCGAPFEAPVGEGMLCGACMAYPPSFTSARAAMIYDDASKGILLGFKHADRTHGAKALAAHLKRAGADILANADLLLPVPLHRGRLYKRRYNQSALLSHALAAQTGVRCAPDGLHRIRATQSQGHMNRKERAANVKGAFAVSPRYTEAVSGKKMILIDDVLTTGATLNECSAVLLAAGAKAVHALTIARVRTAS